MNAGNAQKDPDIRYAILEIINSISREDDDVAEKRFGQSVASVAQYMQNMCDRRLHRLPKNHPNFKVRKIVNK